MSDPLDSDNFDPIDYINRHFPSEASLVELDTFMVGISSKISGLDDEISRAVQGQSRAGEQATRVSALSCRVVLFCLVNFIGGICCMFTNGAMAHYSPSFH
jgi:hypothetical protein